MKDIQDAGGIITLDDLANYKVVKRKVLADEIGDLTLYTMPVPSGGPVVTYILNILKGKIVCSTAFYFYQVSERNACGLKEYCSLDIQAMTFNDI